MQNRFYKVNRDDIYVGSVVKLISGLYRCERLIDGIKQSTVDATNCVPLRAIMFVPDKNKLATDLLYSGQHYPVFNVTKDEDCLDLETGAIVVKNACNLAPILKFAGFNKSLTYRNVVSIKNVLFAHHKPLDSDTLVKLCALSGMHYEKNADIEEDFWSVILSHFQSQELAKIFLGDIKDLMSIREYFQPDYLEETGVKRLSFFRQKDK